MPTPQDDHGFYFLNEPPRCRPVGKPPLLLLLHGVGGSEYDLFWLPEYLDPRFLVLSLRAPYTLRPDSYAWFNVTFGPQGSIIEPEQAEASRQRLITFVESAPDRFQIDRQQIYLLGFSQGAIMSLAVALTRPDLLAGVVALSGRILPELFDRQSPLGGHLAAPKRLADFPLLVIHGRWDRVLSIDHGRTIRDRLFTLPVSLSYHEFDMAHTISDDSLDCASQWLKERLG